MNDLVSITSVLLLAFLGGEIALRFQYPRVIGQLLIGLLLGLPFMKVLLLTDTSIQIIDMFSELGVIFLLLLTGLDLDLGKFNRSLQESLIIAVSSAVTPFFLGLLAALAMGMSPVAGLVLGASLSVTAEGTTSAIFLELKAIRTRVASIMLGAGIMDDIFEVLFLAGVLILTNSATLDGSFSDMALRILAVVAVVFLIVKCTPHFVRMLEKKKSDVSLFSLILLIALLLSVATQLIGIGSFIGAFIAGIILQRSFVKMKDKDDEEHNLHVFSFAFVVPFFFASVGQNFDYHVLFDHPLLVLSVLTIAIVGKIAGTMLTYPLVNLSWKQLHLIGWGMNSRGVMELVIASVALKGGLIEANLYSAIVCMTIITTIMFPFALRAIIRRNPDIMD